ncbi:DUF2244 domain-containing protein [Rhodophyticola sp. CCM32]|uniref:DUF2244 domain-containing protein n=1 Tax=Rhodophyticola sp. CCM32 TaxID=2916397 RepID=UPI00107F10E3|nr:DUF2244 domain-containing protein [Rhodophyticola sp. CCM32]QBX99512.1 DUF2244 domain-containing protein [Rhodophyticola sp. CCM32]
MPVYIDTADTGAAEDFAALSDTTHGLPRLRMILRPHRSLTPDGFVWFIGVTASLISLPLLAVIGTSLFWGLLPFIIAAVTAIWVALKRSWRDRAMYEELILWDRLIRLERHDPHRARRDWQANPYWVRVTLYAKGGPVPNYITLSGGDREVEIGAFLTPGERVALKDRLEQELLHCG